LYPAGFRERFGAPLQRDFQDEYREVRGPGDVVRLWVRTLADIARSLPGQIAREFRQDARHAFRLWRLRPLPALFAVIVLAIAIGATTGVFSVLNAVLLRSLPFREPDRLAALHMFSPEGARTRTAFDAWRHQSPYLDDAAQFVVSEVTLDGSSEALRVRLAETSSNFFSLLGVEPAHGRAFAPDEDEPGKTSVAVIGHAIWLQRFGGDPETVGRTIRLNGVPFTIVGVAPAGVDYPQKAQIWTPSTYDWQRVAKAGVVFWTVVGRLKSDLNWIQARQAFESEAYAQSPERRTRDAGNRPNLIPLQTQLAGPVGRASLVLLAGVVLLLLLACVNVANLLMSRTVARGNELVIRTVLGASRARLVQQLLTETLLLSGLATAAGLLVALWTARVATAAQPAQLATQAYSILDWHVLGFAIATSCLTGLVFGVGPALYASRIDAGFPGRTTTAPPRRTRMRNVLIATQVALTIALTTGSFALGRAFLALLRIDNGYELRTLATMSVSFAGTGYNTAESTQAYYRDVINGVGEIPGVVAVSATESLPLNVDAFMGGRYSIDTVNATAPISTLTLVAPSFFSTIGSRMLAGREFASGDLQSGEMLAIVNETFARPFGSPESAVGRFVVAAQGKPRRIVGVVQDLRFTGPASPAGSQVFFPSRSPRNLTLVVRVTGNARDRIAVIRDVVRRIDSKVAVFDVKTMEERLDVALARPKFYATALVFFGGLAVLLAVIGVYGVVSYNVMQRTREMGIRLALGITPGLLRVAVILQTGRIPFAFGVAPGVVLGLQLARSGDSLVAGSNAGSPATVIAAMAITAAIVCIASVVATRHISRLDVLEVIRSECGE
jgi:putative ABC transport system permease protein